VWPTEAVAAALRLNRLSLDVRRDRILLGGPGRRRRIGDGFRVVRIDHRHLGTHDLVVLVGVGDRRGCKGQKRDQQSGELEMLHGCSLRRDQQFASQSARFQLIKITVSPGLFKVTGVTLVHSSAVAAGRFSA